MLGKKTNAVFAILASLWNKRDKQIDRDDRRGHSLWRAAIEWVIIYIFHKERHLLIAAVGALLASFAFSKQERPSKQTLAQEVNSFDEGALVDSRFFV